MMFDALLQPTHLLIIFVICLLLFGRSMPEIARWVGKKSVEFRRVLRALANYSRESGNESRRQDEEEPGSCAARREPPDKPRPSANVALTPPKSEDD